MNSRIKEHVTAFSNYAKQLLHEQEVQLKKVKDDHLLSGKLAHIKVFNEHLELLKDKLRMYTDATLASSRQLAEDQFTALAMALKHISDECVNEYLCISFIKDRD